jgi:hypothetical protein
VILQRRCACGQPAVTVKTIRRYCTQGWLEPLWAAHFVPRADMPPAPPRCVHHMVRVLVDALERSIEPAPAQHDGVAYGSPCCARAKRGSLYCHAHESRPRQLWSLRPRQMGHQCKATSVTTGVRCRNGAVRPHGVCWQHGAADVLAAKAIAAALISLESTLSTRSII